MKITDSLYYYFIEAPTYTWASFLESPLYWQLLYAAVLLYLLKLPLIIHEQYLITFGIAQKNKYRNITYFHIFWVFLGCAIVRALELILWYIPMIFIERMDYFRLRSLEEMEYFKETGQWPPME